MLIIDGHTHIFPDKIAEKASKSIGEFYDIPMRYDGTVGTLLSLGEKYGISKHLTHSVATLPEQVLSINDFISDMVKANPDRLIGFATLHPDMEDVESEVSRVIDLGLKGIKMHPDFQRFKIDEPRLDKLYKTIEGRLPLLIHTGDSRYDFSSPARVPPVLDKFPALNMICAHFGGWSEWNDAQRILSGRRVWVDTCSSLSFIGKEKTLELIDCFGEDYVIFGSDYPMWDPGDEIEMIKSLGLTQEQLEKLFYKNLCSLVGI